MTDLPFDGEIRRYFREDAPSEVRDEIEDAKKGEILATDFPYDKKWKRSEYEDALATIQIELVKMQAWARETGQRIAIVFEGRDAAGKGGTIKRFRENLNPRGARVVALSKPTDAEAGQWYFQRYIQHLPTAGEIVCFDRSWYNRGVVEKVFGFCDDKQRDKWFEQVNPFEQMLVDEGIKVFKIWLTVDRAAQLQRFMDRESDPLKQWKLSWIDVEGLKKWDEYSAAISETLAKTHTDDTPWLVVRSADKRRARVNAIRAVLQQLDYTGKNAAALGDVDPKITGGPEHLGG
ncbi:polyphosphate kinase 2, PA0141 family [Octadecabacter temperatus]|uniref:ADP/GDP-polyphosphate phosphotransferase n=1 Tax=Octadecabacter temperatus TaxID=1458307 RepID=A0A0K0Y501_9RHOB|nr:polyphosphate kinase 2 [Octadecabacter temperatus]AKS45956.1 Thymidylate kinase [Octadecabacter temperatus]SIO04360.1 polyphosphate kinase 2, PA0141 family [Octadecabacter temperatus]